MVDKNQAKKDMIKAAEPYEGYWEDSYDYVFSVMQQHFQNGPGEKMLELGCGRGEFIDRYAEYFEHIIAVEKDPKSRDQAMEKVYWNDIENIEFLGDPANEDGLDTESFDFILLGQSLQYMPEDDFQETMEKSMELLKKGGRVAIIVPHRKPGQEIYTQIYADEKGEYVSEKIDSEAFNDLAAVNRGPLAMKRFSIQDFQNFEGLDLVEARVFHDVLLPSYFDRFLPRDRIINLPFLKKYFGSRLMLVLEKA